MRIEKEYFIKGIKVTLFNWNNKYLLKFETGSFEQTYKFSEFDFSPDEIQFFLTDEFLDKVKNTFIQMNKNIQTSGQ